MPAWHLLAEWQALAQWFSSCGWVPPTGISSEWPSLSEGLHARRHFPPSDGLAHWHEHTGQELLDLLVAWPLRRLDHPPAWPLPSCWKPWAGRGPETCPQLPGHLWPLRLAPVHSATPRVTPVTRASPATPPQCPMYTVEMETLPSRLPWAGGEPVTGVSLVQVPTLIRENGPFVTPTCPIHHAVATMQQPLKAGLSVASQGAPSPRTCHEGHLLQTRSYLSGWGAASAQARAPGRAATRMYKTFLGPGPPQLVRLDPCGVPWEEKLQQVLMASQKHDSLGV